METQTPITLQPRNGWLLLHFTPSTDSKIVLPDSATTTSKTGRLTILALSPEVETQIGVDGEALYMIGDLVACNPANIQFLSDDTAIAHYTTLFGIERATS